MQYIQLQGQVAEALDLPINGSYNLFIDTSDNLIKAQDSDGNLTGGGTPLIEVTKAGLDTAISGSTLIPGAFYKITGVGGTGSNRIQEGGDTVILQAATTSSINLRGIGLFWNPKYYNPSTDLGEYSVWDNSLRLRTDRSITGAFFDMGETINCDAPANVILKPNIIDDMAIVTLTDYAASSYFSNAANYPIPFTSSNTGITGDFIEVLEYPSYAEGDKVIWGGRVWENLNGNVGSTENRWELNPEDWEVVPYFFTDYNLVADIIEYDYENNSISYRKNVKHNIEVSSNYWERDGDINAIREFPWGHPDIYDVSLENTSTSGLVNFDNTNSIDGLHMKNSSRFEANYWGKHNNFNKIFGDCDSDIENLSLGRYVTFSQIRLGINSTIGSGGVLYIVGNDGDTMTDITMTTNCDIYGIELYQYARLDNISMGMNSDIYAMTMYDDSYLQDIEMSMGSSIHSITAGKSSNINNIRLEDDAYLANLNLDTSSTINTISLARSSFIEYTSLGVGCSMYDIELGFDSAMYCNSLINQNGNTSNINSISLGSGASANNITLYDNTYIENVKISDNGSFDQVGLTGSGAYISNFDVEQNGGFGGLSINATNSPAFLNNFKIGQNSGFGGMGITGPVENVTIERGFNNWEAGKLIAGVTASFDPGFNWANTNSLDSLDTNKSFQILDTTGWDASTTTLNYYLADGDFDGQTIKFFMTSDGTNINGNAGNLRIWLNSFSSMDDFSNVQTQQPWYPFSQNTDYTQMRVDIPQCIWLNGRWIIDNDAWD